jgi:hypothetical protein
MVFEIAAAVVCLGLGFGAGRVGHVKFETELAKLAAVAEADVKAAVVKIQSVYASLKAKL